MDGCGDDAAIQTAKDLDTNNISNALSKLMECSTNDEPSFLAKVKEHDKRWIGSDLVIKQDPVGAHGFPVIDWEIQ